MLFGERKQTDSERWARRRLSVVLQACTRARVSLVGRVLAGKNSAFGHGVGLLNIRVCKPGEYIAVPRVCKTSEIKYFCV